MTAFEKKLGKNFLKQIPTTPGVYRVFDENHRLIYVGKAINLRRRLSQYKNVGRVKKHRKMQRIVAAAAQIQIEICTSILEAEILESRIIQAERPAWNIAGAFYFLYPLIGMKEESGQISFVYTTLPQEFEGYQINGAYRSRDITGEAFFSLMRLLRYVGHPVDLGKPKFRLNVKYSYKYSFRQLPTDSMEVWGNFWRGKSKEALELLVLSLLENAGARKTPKKIQELLNHLKRFWKHEATPLAEAIKLCQYSRYPLSQLDRDPVFLQYRYLKRLNAGANLHASLHEYRTNFV